MVKNNLLILDLNEAKSKRLGEVITNDTSRKILNHLAGIGEEGDTKINMSKMMDIPHSTVRYHIQKLEETELIVSKEFHYSSKGNTVEHYKLANKYIIIAPAKTAELKEKLKDILPAGLVAAGIALFTGLVRSLKSRGVSPAGGPSGGPIPPVQEPNIVSWVLSGIILTIIVYTIITLIKNIFRKKID